MRKTNKEGYYDPTAYGVLNEEREKEYRKFKRTLDALYAICDATGYCIENRIVLRDRKNGKIWR